MATKKNDLIMQNKVFALIALGTATILSIPFMAMLFKWEGWDWKLADFIVMGLLIFGTGFLFVHTARITPRKYRVLIGSAFALALLTVWAELAVGVFGTPFAGS